MCVNGIRKESFSDCRPIGRQKRRLLCRKVKVLHDLESKVFDLRKDALEIIKAGHCGHIGGDMSVMDILAVIYSRLNVSPKAPDDPNRDRFVLSKGHCVEALYAVLADKGFINKEDIIKNYSGFGSVYIGHPVNKVPGIEVNSGSLGHGLSLSTGMALAAKKDGRSYRVYTVMGDGELAEGSVWEAVMAAAHYGLNNLCAVVDRNGLQISGSTEDVMTQGNVGKRFASFGWNVIEVENGNNVMQLQSAFDCAELCTDKPTIIVAHTVKGFGSALIENKYEWHHRVPSEEEYRQICSDLARRKEAVLHEYDCKQNCNV